MGLLFLLCTIVGDTLGLLLCYEVGIALSWLTIKYVQTIPAATVASWHEFMPAIIPPLQPNHWNTWGTITIQTFTPAKGQPASLTLNMMGLILITLYLCIVIRYILQRGWQHLENRMHLDHLTKQQQDVIQRIYEASLPPDVAKQLHYPMPQHVLYRPGPRFYRIYWQARFLVIDGGLLTTHENPSLQPLLLHAIGQYNSSDIWLRWILSLLPPFGTGSLVMRIAWHWYWQGRVLVADRFVVWAGHSDALLFTLDHIMRPLEHAQHRLWRDEPYIDQRIEAIYQYREDL